VEQKSSVWRDARRWLPGVLISLVALFILFQFSNWNWASLVQSWAAFQWPTLAALVGLTIVSLFVRALLWRTLLEERAPILRTFFIINMGYMLNNLFPLRAGEVGRAVFMGSATRLSPFHVLSTIVIERAFDLVMAAVLVLATLPLALGQDWMRPVASVTLVLVASVLVVLYLMARFRAKVHQMAAQMGKRWPLFQRLIIPQVDALLEGLQALVSIRRFLTVLGLVIVAWSIWIVIYYIGILAIAPAAPFWWAMFADSVLALGVAIPAAPAALGVYEASMVAALTVLGVAYSPALAYAFLMHFIQFALTAVFGFWGLAREGKSLGNLWAEIRMANTSKLEKDESSG
jgi:glycosyltransferase 2 family protein